MLECHIDALDFSLFSLTNSLVLLCQLHDLIHDLVKTVLEGFLFLPGLNIMKFPLLDSYDGSLSNLVLDLKQDVVP